MTEASNPETSPAPGANAKEAVSAVGWSFLDKWVGRLVTLGVFVILARLLPLEAFGIVALASVAIELLALLADQGISRAVVVETEANKRFLSTAFYMSCISGVVFAGLLVLTAPVIASLLDEPQLQAVLQWLALMFVFRGFSITQESLMKRQLRFRVTAMRRVFATIGGGVIGVACAFAGAGIWSLVAQTVGTAAIGALVLAVASGFRPSWEFDTKACKRMWFYGQNVLGIDLLSFLSRNGDNFIVGTFLGPTALGFYSIAYKVLSIFTELVIGVVSSTSLPLFARIKDDREATRRAIMKAAKYSAAFSMPVFSGLLVLAPEVVRVAFGEKWMPAVPVVQVFCILGLLNCVTSFDRSVMLAAGRQRLELSITLAGTLLNLVAFLIAVRWGFVAVGIALTARAYLFWPVRLWALNKVVGLSIPGYLKQWSMPLLAALILMGAAYGASRVPSLDVVRIGVGALAGAAAYLVTLRLIDRKFIAEIIRLGRSMVPSRTRLSRA